MQLGKSSATKKLVAPLLPGANTAAEVSAADDNDAGSFAASSPCRRLSATRPQRVGGDLRGAGPRTGHVRGAEMAKKDRNRTARQL